MATFFFPIFTKCKLPMTHMSGTREDGLGLEMNLYYVERFDRVQQPIIIESHEECMTYIKTFFTIRMKCNLIPALSENEKWAVKLINAVNSPANCVQLTITTGNPKPVPNTNQSPMIINQPPSSYPKPSLQQRVTTMSSVTPSSKLQSQPQTKPSLQQRVIEIDDEPHTSKQDSEIKFYSKS